MGPQDEMTPKDAGASESSPERSSSSAGRASTPSSGRWMAFLEAAWSICTYVFNVILSVAGVIIGIFLAILIGVWDMKREERRLPERCRMLQLDASAPVAPPTTPPPKN